jgi:capsular exopolysaccharide synthesis family protein
MNKNQLYKHGSEAGALPALVEVPHFREETSEKAPNGGKRLWAMLSPHKGLIFGCAAACAAIALGASLLQTPQYKAQVSMEIEDLNGHFLQLDEVDPVARGNADSFLSTQIDMLSSNKVLERVIARLNLEQEYQKASPGLIHPLLEKVSPQLFPAQTAKEMAIATLKKNLTISAPRSTSRVVSVEYISEDARLAAAVPNTLAQEFIDQGVELRIQSAHRLNGWLTQEVDQSRQRLQDSEEALQRYGQSAGLLFTDEKNSVAEAKLKQLQDEFSKAQADRMVRQSTYELIAKANPDALGDIVGNTKLQDYQLKLTDLRRQLAEAQAIMTPGHYKVKQLAAQVAELEAAVGTTQGETKNRVSSEYGAARRREELLEQAYIAQEKLVTAQDARASRYNVLKNEVDTNRQLYDSMLQRVKGVGLASAMRSSNVAIFDPAEAPNRPYKPMPLINTAIGLFSGLLLSGIYVFLRNTWDESLRTPGQVGTYLNVPELGVVPSAEPMLAAKSSKGRALLTAGALTAQGVEHTMMQSHSENGFGAQNNAHIVDSFRSILASVLLSGGNGKAPSVIVITSPSPQEGKTTNASNLAVALASIGKRVLLIDGDLRKPRLHEIFGLRNTRGFSDLLVEHEEGDESSFPQTTKIPHLSVLTVGRNRAVGSNLLYGPRSAVLISRLRRDFDAVLIDTPPVLSLADARVLSRSADGVILVCRAGATNRERAKIAVDLLVRDGAHVIGTILNDIDPRSSGYDSGGYYHAYTAIEDNDGKAASA